jgi:hypothetical protein
MPIDAGYVKNKPVPSPIIDGTPRVAFVTATALDVPIVIDPAAGALEALDLSNFGAAAVIPGAQLRWRCIGTQVLHAAPSTGRD